MPFVQFGRLTVPSLGKSVHVGKNILNLYLGVAYVLLEQIDGVFRLQRMKSVEASRLVLHPSLQLLQSVVGRFHLSVHFLRQSLQPFEPENRKGEGRKKGIERRRIARRSLEEEEKKKTLLPFYLIDYSLFPLLVKHHQSVPILLDHLDVKLGLDVHLAHRLEILLKIPEQIGEALLVPVTWRHLLVLEFRAVRGELLHLDQSGGEGPLLHQAHFLADPQMEGAR